MSEQQPKKIKLTLTMDVLEKMIGGDTEVELQVRQGIAQQFASKFLKGMINDEIEAQINRLRQEVARCTKAAFDEATSTPIDRWGSTPYMLLSPQQQQVIRDAVKRELNGVVIDQVRAHYQDQGFAAEVKTCCATLLPMMVNEYARREVRSQIGEFVGGILRKLGQNGNEETHG